MRWKLLLPTLALAATGLRAQAETLPLQEAMRGASRMLLKMYADEGYARISSQRVSRLRERMGRTRWGSAPVFFAGSGGVRMSGVNMVEENQVLLTRFILETFQNGRVSDLGMNTFVLHEALGAVGVDDEDYGASLAIVFLGYQHELLTTLPEVRAVFEARLGATRHFTRNRVYDDASVAGDRADGGTSVGGGGDIVALDIKTQLLVRAAARGALSQDYARAVLNLGVSVVYTMDTENGRWEPPLSLERREPRVTLSHHAWTSSFAEERSTYRERALELVERRLEQR
jgi:hypothetical protein